jgi:hypothetical protein
MEKRRYIMPGTEVLAISSEVWMAFSGSNPPAQAGTGNGAKRRDLPF